MLGDRWAINGNRLYESRTSGISFGLLLDGGKLPSKNPLGKTMRDTSRRVISRGLRDENSIGSPGRDQAERLGQDLEHLSTLQEAKVRSAVGFVERASLCSRLAIPDTRSNTARRIRRISYLSPSLSLLRRYRPIVSGILGWNYENYFRRS
jgi:hypothetical protein